MKASMMSARFGFLVLFASLTACERTYDVGFGNASSGGGSGMPGDGAVPALEPDTDHVADDDIQIVNPENDSPNSGNLGAGGSGALASGSDSRVGGSDPDTSDSGPSNVSTGPSGSGGGTVSPSNPSLPSDIKSGVCPAKLNPGLFQLGGHAATISGSAKLNANLMLGPNSSGRLSGSVILQSLVKDASASWMTEGSVIVSKKSTVDTSANVQAALAASDSAAALTPTHATMNLASTTDANILRIVGNGGLNVIQVSGFDLQGSNVLTLSGGSNETFVFNIGGKFRVGGAFMLNLEGGLKASNVLFNIVGNGPDVSVSGSAILRGTILAPRRSVTLEGSSMLKGAIVAGGDMILTGSAGAFQQATLCDSK